MTAPQSSISLTIHLTQEQIGFLAYAFPNEDPEDALVKLLDLARSRAIRRAEQQVRVLHPGQEETECQETSSEESASQVVDVVENPIGKLQELCQRQQISMPVYEFEELAEGFRCTVLAMSLSAMVEDRPSGIGEGPSKKVAKVGTARRLLEMTGKDL